MQDPKQPDVPCALLLIPRDPEWRQSFRGNQMPLGALLLIPSRYDMRRILSISRLAKEDTRARTEHMQTLDAPGLWTRPFQV